jgi:hypothetical protein
MCRLNDLLGQLVEDLDLSTPSRQTSASRLSFLQSRKADTPWRSVNQHPERRVLTFWGQRHSAILFATELAARTPS